MIFFDEQASHEDQPFIPSVCSLLRVRCVVFGLPTPVKSARGQCPNQIYTDEEMKTLDEIAFSVAQEIAKVDKILPRDKWTPAFKG